MGYIGKTPALGNYQKCDAITTSATATYNLLVGSVAVSPETANNCIVSLNGVIQAPTDAYTIVGSTIVFNSALTSADVIDFILVLGDVLDIGTVSDGTITAAKLADTAISGKTALAVAPADTDEFLVSDAGTLKRIDYSLIKGGGAWNLIKTLTSDGSDATMSFVDGTSDVVFDTTYNHYVFIWNSIHVQTGAEEFTFQVSTDGGSNYNISAIDSAIANYIRTDNAADHSLEIDSYVSAGTNFRSIFPECDAQATSNCSGELHIFNPAGTTFHKHYQSHGTGRVYYGTNYQMNAFNSGAFATTSALNAVQFKMSSGEIQGGTISLYGIST